MATTKTFKNQIKLKYDKNLKPADAKKMPKLEHQVSMRGVTNFDGEDVKQKQEILASFSTNKGEIATVFNDRVMLSANYLGAQNTEKLKQLFPDCFHEGNGLGYFTLPIKPPEAEHIDVYTKDATAKGESHTGGSFEMTITNSQGVEYTCIIDPLGIIIKNDEQEVIKRATLDNVKQEDIVDAEMSPALFLAMLDKNNPLVKTPDRISNISPQFLDLFFRNIKRAGIQHDEKTGAYKIDKYLSSDPKIKMLFPNPEHKFDPKYQFIAVPAGVEDGEQQFYYLAKNTKNNTVSVLTGNGFKSFKAINLIQKDNEFFVALSNSSNKTGNQKEDIRYLQIPKEDKQPKAEFIKAIQEFTKLNPFPNSKDSQGIIASNGEQIPFQNATTTNIRINALTPGVGNTTISANIDKEKGDEFPPPPPPPDKPPEKPDGKPGRAPRKNPYQDPPTHAVKKKPVKLNEDAIRYGGVAISLLLAVLAFAFPFLAPILGTLAAVTFVGSQVLAVKVPEINGSPLNQLAVDYVNGLAKNQQEAENEAKKFWEKETEYGNVSDNLKELEAQVLSPEFAQSPNGILIQRLLNEQTAGTSDWAKQNTSNLFWTELLLDKREKMLYGLQELTSNCQGKSSEEITKIQEKFLQDYGFVKNNATMDELASARERVFAPVQVEDPESHELKEMGWQGLVGLATNSLYTYNSLTIKKQNLHNQVGDMLEECSGRAFDRIIGQKGVDLEKFVEEHSADLARRFLFRKDLTQAQIEEFFDKISPESVEKIQKVMEQDIPRALKASELIGKKQKLYNENYFQAIDLVSSIQDIANDSHNKKFDESQIKNSDQIANATGEMLWAIKAEDLKRNGKLFSEVQTDTPLLDKLLMSEGKTLISHKWDSVNGISPSTYSARLDSERQLLQNEELQKLLANEIIMVGASAGILTLTTGGEVSKNSLTDLFKSLQDSPKISDDLRKKIQAVINPQWPLKCLSLEETRQQLVVSEQTLAINTLYKKFFENNDQNIEIEEKLAKLMTDDQGDIERYFQNLIGADPKKVVAAKAELKTLINNINSGDYAQKLVSDFEKKHFDETAEKDSHKKLQEIPTKAEIRDNLLSMHNLLEGYNLNATQIEYVIKNISSIQNSKYDKKTQTQKVLDTLLNYAKEELSLSDCTHAVLENETDIKNVFNSILCGSEFNIKFVNTNDKLNELKAKLKKMQKARLERSKQQLKKHEQVAGRKQTQHSFNRRRRGEEEESVDESEQPRLTIAERRLNKTYNKTNEFFGKISKTANEFKKLGAFTGNPANKTADEIIKQVNALKSSLQAVLGRDINKLLVDKNGKKISWQDLERMIKEKQFDLTDFKRMKERALRLIKKKEKKKLEKLKKKKEKAAKKDKKASRSPASNQTMATNRRKFGRAKDAVSARRSADQLANNAGVREFAPNLSQEFSSPAPRSSDQNAGPSA